MKKLAIIGAGGHGKVVAEAALLTKTYQQISFVDNTPNYLGSEVLGLSVIAETFNKLDSREYDIHIAIGSNAVRKTIYEQVKGLGFQLATIIHPSAIISPTAKIGEGSVVMAGAVIQTETQIGRCVIVNTGASVDHECKVSDFVHLSPQSILAGNVAIKEGCWIGAGAVCREKIIIGANNVVGANSFVNKELTQSNLLYVGNPVQVMYGEQTVQPNKVRKHTNIEDAITTKRTKYTAQAIKKISRWTKIMYKAT